MGVSDIFVYLFNMSITAGFLIMAVVLARSILKRVPRWIICLLWMFVGIRLTFPMTVECPFSLIPEGIGIRYTQDGTIAEKDSDGSRLGENVSEVISGEPASTGIPSAGAATHSAMHMGDGVTTQQGMAAENGIFTVCGFIWAVGFTVMIGYFAISYFRLKKRTGEGLELPGGRNGIYLCDRIGSPFILGVFRPRICLPSGIDNEQLESVLAHEYAHLGRWDHWWKLMGFMLLSVYWFNPLCWLAYILFCRDIELACDEKVVKGMDLTEKKAYSEALLASSTAGRPISVCTLAFGEISVRERVEKVLNYKKPTAWIIVAALAVCVVVAVCFLTIPKSDKGGGTGQVQGESNIEEIAGYRLYSSSKLLYLTLFSSQMVTDADNYDSGYGYMVDTAAGKIKLIQKDTGYTTEVESQDAVWEDIDIKQWKSLFFGGESEDDELWGIPDISGISNPRMMKLSEKYYLFNMDGSLWLGQYSGDKSKMWEVCELTPYSF